MLFINQLTSRKSTLMTVDRLESEDDEIKAAPGATQIWSRRAGVSSLAATGVAILHDSPQADIYKLHHISELV